MGMLAHGEAHPPSGEEDVRARESLKQDTTSYPESLDSYKFHMIQYFTILKRHQWTANPLACLGNRVEYGYECISCKSIIVLYEAVEMDGNLNYEYLRRH